MAEIASDGIGAGGVAEIAGAASYPTVSGTTAGRWRCWPAGKGILVVTA